MRTWTLRVNTRLFLLIGGLFQKGLGLLLRGLGLTWAWFRVDPHMDYMAIARNWWSPSWPLF